MAARQSAKPAQSTQPQGDGTRELLRWGGSMVGTGLAATVLLETLLGGFSRTGASTNTGWFALIVALMCIPFGGLLLALGVAKWLRNRSLARRRRSLDPSAHVRDR
jgi:uncharacterized membrane protein YidH (DUF202 family)